VTTIDEQREQQVFLEQLIRRMENKNWHHAGIDSVVYQAYEQIVRLRANLADESIEVDETLS